MERKPIPAGPRAPGRETSKLGRDWRHPPRQTRPCQRRHFWRIVFSGHRLFIQHSPLLFFTSTHWPSSQVSWWAEDLLLGTPPPHRQFQRPPLQLEFPPGGGGIQNFRSRFSPKIPTTGGHCCLLPAWISFTFTFTCTFTFIFYHPFGSWASHGGQCSYTHRRGGSTVSQVRAPSPG